MIRAARRCSTSTRAYLPPFRALLLTLLRIRPSCCCTPYLATVCTPLRAAVQRRLMLRNL